jgi:hypothetical protein
LINHHESKEPSQLFQVLGRTGIGDSHEKGKNNPTPVIIYDDKVLVGNVICHMANNFYTNITFLMI